MVGSQAPHTWQMWRAAAVPEMNLVRMGGALQCNALMQGVVGMMVMVDMKRIW